jgi:hypothetical protein
MLLSQQPSGFRVFIASFMVHKCRITKQMISFFRQTTDDPTCERCLEDEELATHILCDCEAIANVRFRHLGQFFMEPSDYYDTPINRVLHFIPSAGLIKG